MSAQQELYHHEEEHVVYDQERAHAQEENGLRLGYDPNADVEVEVDVEVDQPGLSSFSLIDELVPIIGQRCVDALRKHGLNTMEEVIQHNDKTIIGLGIPENKLKAVKEMACKNSGFKSANAVLEERKKMINISTGSNAVDTILSGGVETGSITEVYGEFNTGKTQFCHTLCVTAQIARGLGGAEGRVLYIDSEGTFRPERIVQICDSRGFDSEVVLDNIQVAVAKSSDHQMDLLSNASEFFVKDRYSLLIVDSCTSLLRAEYTGRGNLSERQTALQKMLRQLHILAQTYNVAVVLTNQVVSDIGGAALMGGGGDNKKPIGGNIMGHAATTRLQFRKGKGGSKVVKIVDSPMLAENEAQFKITEAGVTDTDQ